jgi:spore coat protein E
LKANTELTQGNDIIVRTLSQPTCSNVNINDLTIEFTIDKELGVELVGETKVKIAIEEEEEPWDIIEDDVDDDVLNDIDNTVNEEYLN